MKRWFVRWLFAIAVIPLTLRALGTTHESFETAEISWQLGPRDCPVTIITHERRFTDAHGGRGCEYVELSSGPGTKIQLLHSVQPALVIPELAPELWVKSDLPGIQLQARVIFPRSVDRDGKPLSALVMGDSYTQAKSWRQLRIDDLARKVQRVAVGLRTQPGQQVDEREAYIDLLVLNVFTEPRPNRIWIDDLAVNGAVAANRPEVETGLTTGVRAVPHDPASRHGPSTPSRQPTTGLQGSVLLRDGRPIFVRSIEHRGETMAFLQSLGFNAAVLRSPPTESQINEAERTGIWLIAPPPQTSDGFQILPVHDPILAWYLGDNLTGRDAPRINDMVWKLRLSESNRDRPLLLHVAGDYSQFQHDSGVLVFDRNVMGTSFELSDFGPWLKHASLHGRSGAPYWAAISTELPARLVDQVARMSQTAAVGVSPEPDLPRQLAFEALACGARGLWFRSGSRLDVRDKITQLRALVLQALNRELELVAPWAAAGTAAGERSTSNPRIRVWSLNTDTSRLLIATRVVSDQQFVAPPFHSHEPLTFTLHGASLSDRPYLVSAQGITPAQVQRGGGVQITMDPAQPLSLILLTQDQWAINYVGRTSAEHRQDFAARQLEIAEMVLEETESTSKQLANQRAASVPPESELAKARTDLRQASLLLERGDASHAIPLTTRCREICRSIRRAHWEATILNFPSPLASPLCTSFSTLPLHFTTADRLARSPWSVNVLPAGEMEQMDHLIDSGWRLLRAEAPHLEVDARLTLEAPHAGRFSLQLRSWEAGESRRGLAGQWPLTVSSAPVAVRSGELVRIHGWAKVPRRFSNSWDGLMIFDSQSGPDLAERILETQGWQEFVLYRAATATGDLHVVFAQTGPGEAWLDDVSVTLHTP